MLVQNHNLTGNGQLGSFWIICVISVERHQDTLIILPYCNNNFGLSLQILKVKELNIAVFNHLTVVCHSSVWCYTPQISAYTLYWQKFI